MVLQICGCYVLAYVYRMSVCTHHSQASRNDLANDDKEDAQASCIDADDRIRFDHPDSQHQRQKGNP
jgi:hypothetical protein